MEPSSPPSEFAPRRRSLAGAFSSLEHRQFRWIFASNVAFFFAMNGQMIVRSYLAFKLTDSAFALGLINLAVAIPMLIVSPFGGVLADRVERRRLIIAGQAFLLCSELVILALLLTDSLAFWHLVAVAFLMGGVFPVMMPARQAIVVNIVGRQGLGSSMALQMSSMQASRIVAPVLAGSVIAVAGTEVVYAAAVVLYFVALLAMTRIDPAPPPPAAAGRSVFGDILDGIAYVRGDGPVRALLALSLIPILLAMPFQALLVVFAEDVWDNGSRGLGYLQAAAGLGGIIGSAYVAWLGDVDHRFRIMMSSLLAFCGTLFLFAISPWFLLALPLVLIADVFASVFTTVNGTTIQLLIPDEVRGRVMSIMMMTFGLTPLGTVPVSALAQAFGAPFAVAVASLTTLALSIGFLLLIPSLRAVDATSRAAIASGASPRPRFPAAPNAPASAPTT